MKKLLLLLNRLEIENHLPELIEIANTHEIAKVFLAKASPEFGSRVRSIVAPHKLDMAARLSDDAANSYLVQIAEALRKRNIDCEAVSTSIPAKRLDDFIKKNSIDLVLSSDGRSGLARWHSTGLGGRYAQFLYEHAFTGGKADSTARATGNSGGELDTKKMLVLLNRLDIDERLTELRDIAQTLGVQKIHLASMSHAFRSDSQSTIATVEVHPITQVIVYLTRASRNFGSRVRSRVAPQKLDMAMHMSNTATNKYLSKIATALTAEGIEAIPIGITIPLDKVDDYVKKNNVDLTLIGDGSTGLRHWPVESPIRRNIQSGRGFELAKEPDVFERLGARTRPWLGTISGFSLLFGALFAFWIILSGQSQLKYVISGAAAAGLVTLLTYNLVFSVFRNDQRKGVSLFTFSQVRSFIIYLPWLLAKIIIANIQIAYLVLHPRMPIAPALLRFRTRLQNNLAQVIMANSITLTPGTITVSLKDGDYIIHSLAPSSASDVVEAKLQNKVGAIFVEGRERAPKVLWAHSLEELES